MKKKSGLGCLFWLALALLVVVVFLYNRERINRVLASSGLLPAKGSPQVTIRNDKPQPPPAARPAPATPRAPSAAPAPPSAPPSGAAPGTAPPEVVIRVPGAAAPAAPDAGTPTRVRKARIFFVQVNQAGDISLHGVMRSVPYTDSPLTNTLAALLDGEAAHELTGGLLTMIPANVKLRGVAVRGSTAYIDLSDEFRFNALGRAGLVAEIKQLVYTATEFSNVTSVQILIDGRKLDYLSSEGPYIGRPISRDDLINGLS
jgi:germination protein M